MLRVVRSIKNTFTPINRIPPEVLSLIPDHCKTDGDLIELTHVCRSWREIFISCAPLWTRLDCVDLDKTSVYVQRSRDSPLEISLALTTHNYECSRGAFLLTIPHIGRFKALTIRSGSSRHFLELVEYLRSPAPLLERLELVVYGQRPVVIEGVLFDGNLPSLGWLHLLRVSTNLPWRSLSNLTTVNIRQVSDHEPSVTEFLDLFECAPLLREIKLVHSLPASSDAPAGRLVFLTHLRSLAIYAEPPHSILLNHLHIPTGAMVTLEFSSDDRSPPPQDYFPRSLDNLSNISYITSINLDFSPRGIKIQLGGPSGYLLMGGNWVGSARRPPTSVHQTLQALNKLPISSTETLTINQYRVPILTENKEPIVYRTLLLMNNLRTLTLTDCFNFAFFTALDPSQNISNTVVCPNLEELILCIQEQEDVIYTRRLLEMAKERASRGAKLSTIVIACPWEVISEDELSDLRSYVSHVERDRTEYDESSE